MQNELLNIDKKIDKCSLCGNYPKPKCPKYKMGAGKILIVGESPAKNGWLVSNKAFYTIENKLQPTGVTLNKLLQTCNLTLDEVDFTECCKCHIANRNDLQRASINCRQYLLEQIKASECKVILTMGSFATSAILNKPIKKLKDYVGKMFEINFEGFIKYVFPIYHTSPINPLALKGNELPFSLLNELLTKENL